MQLQDVLIRARSLISSLLRLTSVGAPRTVGWFRRRASAAVAVSLLWTVVALGQTNTDVTLAWSASSNTSVVAYNVYSGGASQTYTNMVSFGNVTNATLYNLVPGTTYFFSVTAVDSAGMESPFSNETSYSVPQTTTTVTNVTTTSTNTITTSTNTTTTISNTPPLISGVPNQTININTSTGPLPFWVGDLETPATNLAVFAACSNPALVNSNGLALTQTGTNWTISITPLAGQSGTATISLSVCDPSLCTTTNFVLTVNPLPVVSLTSPVTGSNFTAPATIQLTAGVTANGHSITKVQFFNGSSLLGESTSAPYAFVWNSVGAGTYALSAQLIYDAGSTAVSPPASITVNAPPALPPPWQTADLGTIGISGSAVSTNGLFTLQGAGNISGSADNFRFLYQTLSGDGEIRAQIVSSQNTGAGDFTAVMIRETLTSGSRYAAMGLSPGSGLRWQRRSNTSGGTSSSKGGSATTPNVWVRVVRTGNTFSGYKSVDGASWTLVNSGTVTMASNIYVGLAVASGTTSQLATSTLANVTVVP